MPQPILFKLQRPGRLFGFSPLYNRQPYGVASAPSNTYEIVNHTNTQVTHLGSGVYAIEKTGGVDGTRDAGAISSVGVTGNFVLRIKPVSTADAFGWDAGVNSDPLTDDDYTSIDFGWFYQPSALNWASTENGVFGVTGLPSVTYGWIWRNGSTLGYGRGADLATAQASPDRTTASTGTLFFDSAIANIGGRLEVLLYDVPTVTVYNVDLQAVSTPDVTLARLDSKPLLTATTPVPTLVRRDNKALQTTSTPVPTLSRQTGKPRQTTSTPVPTLARAMAKLLQTTSTPVVTLLRSTSKPLATASTPVPTVVRSTGKRPSGSSTPVPTLLRASIFAKSLQTTSTPVPTLRRAMTKPLQTTSAPTPTLLRAMTKSLLCASTPVPSLSRSLGKRFSVTCTPVPTLSQSRVFFKSFQASTGGVATGGTGGVKVSAFFFR
jgi:hypothetical protein